MVRKSVGFVPPASSSSKNTPKAQLPKVASIEVLVRLIETKVPDIDYETYSDDGYNEEEFICHKTGEIIRDPVMSDNVKVFEKAVIEQHLKIYNTCPRSNADLSMNLLIPANAVRNRIINFLTRIINKLYKIEELNAKLFYAMSAEEFNEKLFYIIGQEDPVLVQEDTTTVQEDSVIDKKDPAIDQEIFIITLKIFGVKLTDEQNKQLSKTLLNAIQNNDVKLARTLRERGITLTEEDKEALTPVLVYAHTCGLLQKIAELNSYGVTLKGNGKQALRINLFEATRDRKIEQARHLTTNGIELMEEHRLALSSALHTAVLNNDMEYMNILCDQGVELTEEQKLALSDLLYNAIINRDNEHINRLKSLGITLNQQNQDQLNRALFDAVQKNRLNESIYLVSQGADCTAQNSQGNTVFHFATVTRENVLAHIRALPHAKEDFSVRNNAGQTPRDLLIAHELTWEDLYNRAYETPFPLSRLGSFLGLLGGIALYGMFLYHFFAAFNDIFLLIGSAILGTGVGNGVSYLIRLGYAKHTATSQANAQLQTNQQRMAELLRQFDEIVEAAPARSAHLSSSEDAELLDEPVPSNALSINSSYGTIVNSIEDVGPSSNGEHVVEMDDTEASESTPLLSDPKGKGKARKHSPGFHSLVKEDDSVMVDIDEENTANTASSSSLKLSHSE